MTDTKHRAASLRQQSYLFTEIWQYNDFQNGGRRHREFPKFSFLITWHSPSSKYAAVYKISWKSDDFSLRYGDISIFKIAAVRHLGIVLAPYKTTHEVSVAGHSCLSNCMWITWNPYSGPQNGGFGDFGPLNVIIHHRDPEKSHPCVNPRLLSYQL